MESIKSPIVRIENNVIQLLISTDLYAKDVINAVCYKYTGICYVYQELIDNVIKVTLEAKEGQLINEQNAKQFCNCLIDQQIREITTERFGHIRDMIVEEAFKPVNK